MPTKSEKLSTSEPLAKATYQTARGVFVGDMVARSSMVQQVRTVVTSAKEGTLGLRYAPHNPKVTDVSTSS